MVIGVLVLRTTSLHKFDTSPPGVCVCVLSLCSFFVFKVKTKVKSTHARLHGTYGVL